MLLPRYLRGSGLGGSSGKGWANRKLGPYGRDYGISTPGCNGVKLGSTSHWSFTNKPTSTTHAEEEEPLPRCAPPRSDSCWLLLSRRCEVHIAVMLLRIDDDDVSRDQWMFKQGLCAVIAFVKKTNAATVAVTATVTAIS